MYMVDNMNWMSQMTDDLALENPQCDSHWESHWVTEKALWFALPDNDHTMEHRIW